MTDAIEPSHTAKHRPKKSDLVVVGGGVIGLSVAWKASSRGMKVTVIDPEPGKGASWAAAGMLAPVTEVHYGEEALLTLNMASAHRWPRFAEELEAVSARKVGYRRCGTFVVAASEADRAIAERLYEFQRELGLEVEWLGGRAMRAAEPNLAPGVRAGLLAAGDHQVDNRLLVTALLEATRVSGCELLRASAIGIEVASGAVEGVRIGDGTLIRAPAVVLAAGARSGDFAVLPGGAALPVRPVKGQILRLRSQVANVARRPVRAIVNGSVVYVVPRADRSVVVGSTVEEKGFDSTVTAGAVYELLRDAQRVLPSVSECHFEEAMAALRPGSPDNAPIIAEVSPGLGKGLLAATGHYRNGVLLTPITCEAITAMLSGCEPPEEVLAFTGSRFEVPSCS